MSSSHKTSLLSEVVESDVLSRRTLAYFQERLLNHIYELVMREFSRKKEKSGFTQTQLAKRIRKDAGQLNRLLHSPGNWTLETLSDLLIGLGAEPAVTISRFEEQTSVEHRAPDWTKQSPLQLNYSEKGGKDADTVEGPRFGASNSNIVTLNIRGTQINTHSQRDGQKTATG